MIYEWYMNDTSINMGDIACTNHYEKGIITYTI